ncbi:MAG: PLP-dependent aminotransferase family protein [Campylobacteraceae bacterium]|nr:PLP-dependent aminotransferase family protein [Campylobacteraceae bacterium]
MLTYALNSPNKPLYEQLYENIKSDILKSVLKGGYKLPSKRTFASHLGISVITVQNAYNQLLIEGFIYSKERSGYFVTKGIKPIKKEVTAPAKKESKKEESFINLSSSNKSSFPLSSWNKILREIISKNSDKIYQNVPFNGVDELRSAISKHLFEYHNLKADKDLIIIGAGAQYLYILITQLLGKDMVFALENISDTKIGRIYQSLGVRCEFIEVDENGMSIDSLRKSGANVAHLSPASNFPTGNLMPITRRSELLEWVSLENERFIIEDEYLGEMRDRTIPPLKSINSQKVIFMNTFSKTLLPTLRISYMVLPEHLMDKFRENLSFYSSTVPIFEQLTLAKFINDGYFERYLARSKKENSLKKADMIKTIKEFDSSMEFKESLTHLLLPLNLSSDELKTKAKKDGFLVNSLDDYCYTNKNSKDKTVALIDINSDTKDLVKFLKAIS